MHGITPEHTPRLCEAHPTRHAVVMSGPPAHWRSWKEVLLGAVEDPGVDPATVAAALGRGLGTWHDQTWGDLAVAAPFTDYEALRQLRLAPFQHAVAAAHPVVAARVTELAGELESRRDCLVHCDFSPKNVLVGADGLMVLDFEVAHVGAAVFDLAFLHCHLALKAVHMPGGADRFAGAAIAFLDAYQERTQRPLPERLGAYRSAATSQGGRPV